MTVHYKQVPLVSHLHKRAVTVCPLKTTSTINYITLHASYTFTLFNSIFLIMASPHLTMRLSGAVVSTSDYQSADPSSILDEGSGVQLTQLFIFPNRLIDKWIPRETCEGKMWKVGCHSGPVSRRNGSISTTGLKAFVTGDERLRLLAAIVCAPTLTPSLGVPS